MGEDKGSTRSGESASRPASSDVHSNISNRLVLLSVVLFAMTLWYIAVTDEHDIELDSCSRPVLGLLGAVWSFAIVAWVLSAYGLDFPRVLMGSYDPSRPPSAFASDFMLLAVALTLTYLSASVMLTAIQDLSEDHRLWKLFSQGFFGLAIAALVAPVGPLTVYRTAAVKSLGRTLCAGAFAIRYLILLLFIYQFFCIGIQFFCVLGCSTDMSVALACRLF